MREPNLPEKENKRSNDLDGFKRISGMYRLHYLKQMLSENEN